MKFLLSNYSQFKSALKPLTGGIYSISNKITKKIYYGSTYNFLLRLSQHMYCILSGNWSGQSHLYNAIKAEGMENFEYAVVLEMPDATAEERIKKGIGIFWICGSINEIQYCKTGSISNAR